MADWDPERYAQFGGLRLRPALDLLAAVPALPPGAVVDLGCGAGVMAPPLSARFSGRALIGVDRSEAMLAKAQEVAGYDALVREDLSQWTPSAPVALIYSNAALNWVSDHDALLPRLVEHLVAGGVLAVQVPRQSARPSHALWRTLSEEMFPDRFDWADWESEVAAPSVYARGLSTLGEARVWETEYYQRLDPSDEGHPVLLFTRATYGRRVLELLSATEQTRFEARFSRAVSESYPTEADGGVWFPFRRLFFTVEKTAISTRALSDFEIA